MASLGLLGGTFNPPHLGHLICAQEALERLGLDRVLLLPAATPPHKDVADEPGPDVRLALCRAAVAGDARLGVCELEVERGGVSYSVATLRELNERDPGSELTFIVGADMARTLPSWREPREVLRLARVAIADRGGSLRAEIDEALAGLDPGDRVRWFDMTRIDISSTMLRARVAQGLGLRYYVPEDVAREVEARGLYRDAVEARA
jgi:nicotinate-nucleotide adenylyltransferase